MGLTDAELLHTSRSHRPKRDRDVVRSTAEILWGFLIKQAKQRQDTSAAALTDGSDPVKAETLRQPSNVDPDLWEFLAFLET